LEWSVVLKANLELADACQSPAEYRRPCARSELELGPKLQSGLIAALCNPAHFGAQCKRVRLLETHISYVLLTGSYAYKIKKAIRLGFLDFTTLAARRFYCEQELRLNRRLAPALYLDVVAITGSVEQPQIGGSGPILDYAVKMREFPQEALLSNVLEQNALTTNHIDQLATIVAHFHRDIDVAPADGPFGAPDDVLQLALANFAEIRALTADAEERDDLDQLETWTRSEYASRGETIATRRRGGFVRECHGDLHLGNIALVDGALTIFDCIEFNDRMRWIDVMSEVAFTVMDLEHRGRRAYTQRFLNAYLEEASDYGGVAVLRFYVVYRAMVRAKVAYLRAAQLPDGGARAALQRDYHDHVRLAKAYALGARPAVVITHGFAGCGKTTLSQILLERFGAIRIRTDVERKRLRGLGARDSSRSGIDSALYAPEVTRTTYDHLSRLARTVVGSGFTALIDGTFLRRWQRDLFRDLATKLHVPFVIVDVSATETTLRERVRQRAIAATDASEAGVAVLEHQLRSHDLLGFDERDVVVTYDGELPLSHAHTEDAWRGVVDRLSAAAVTVGPIGSVAHSDLQSKIAFLSCPESYSEGTRDVACVETHLSWVFLTDKRAYKLKKPICTAYVDLRDLTARSRNCNEELRLNRRLSSNVYLGAVPLMKDPTGRLSFAPGGDVVDWLVKMRRLPANRMLDRLILAHSTRRADIDSLVKRLCDFYRQSPSVAMAPEQYRQDFADGIATHRGELCEPAYALPAELVEQVSARQLAFLSRAALFDARVQARRIVEGHGDLRPEHICFEVEPQIIDSLEFSQRLRTLDPVDELGFLALECERLGAPEIGTQILDAYRQQSGDAVSDSLVHFYQSYRACARAMLAILHLQEPAQDPAKWRARANGYLELARAHVDHCT
jgi:uncharacterized protein